jgi:hypothetical protein
MENKASSPVAAPAPKPIDTKMSKLKVAFLYVLIGGLVISALISVVSILVGHFNEVSGKALLTTLIFVTHSLLVIAIVSADKNNRLGKDLISTTILGAVIANMFTSTLGTWQLWPNDASWKAFEVYLLAIGVAFIVTASLKLRLSGHKVTNNLVYATIGLILLLALLLVPWIVIPDSTIISSFYYRLVGAVTILAATTLSVSVIINRIAVSQHAELKVKTASGTLTGGMLAIYVSIGTIVALFWFTGFFSFIVGAASVDHITDSPYSSQDNSDFNYTYTKN